MPLGALDLSLLLVLAAVLNCDYVEAFPNGAPSATCQTLSPSHVVAPQSTPSPYQVDLSNLADGTGSFSYVPGQLYQLQFGGANLTFRGVLFQGRLLANDNTPAGSFINFDVNTQISGCSPPEISVTHNNGIDKNEVNVIWIAPPAGTGPVRIGFSVVQTFSVYWANQRSAVINEKGTTPPTGSGMGSGSGDLESGSGSGDLESGSGSGDLESGSGIPDFDNLFPFGFSAGDQLVPPALDGASSPQVKFSFPNITCQFFGTEQDTLFVNTNGVLSFANFFLDFTPSPFPLTSQDDILIAPFWADHNVGAFMGGQIFFRFSSNSLLLDQVGSIISKGFTTDFTPEVLFIATWDRVAAFAAQFSGLVNTYQVVIATDGFSTYVLFLYSDIQWGTSDLTEVGFNAGDMLRGFNLPAASTTAGVLNLENSSNVGVPGMYIFRVDQESIIHPGDIGVTLNATTVEASVVELDTRDFATVRACFTAELDRPLFTRDAVFEFILSNLTTATFGVDFIPNTNNSFLTIPATFSGRFEECIEVFIIGDNDIETDEVVVYDLIPLSSLDTVLFPSGASSLVINILENDVDNTVIEFEQPSYEILEDVGLNNFALRVCINIFNLTTERSVKLSTLSGTARDGVDYKGLSTEIALKFGENRSCVGIVILEDIVPEDDEFFVVQIDEVGVSANVTILNDDDTMLTYIGDSPVVNGTAVSLRLSLGSNVQSATCALVSKGRIRSQTDCSSGRANFTNVPRLIGEFTPVVKVVRRDGEMITFNNNTRNIRLGVRGVCSVHLINEGISLTRNRRGSTVTSIQWGLSRPADTVPSMITFACILDGSRAVSCTSPYVSPAFTSGSQHTLLVIPFRNQAAGCRRAIGRNIKFQAP